MKPQASSRITYPTSGNFGLRPASDVRLGQVVVRVGEPVLCARGSANFDEQVFARAAGPDFARDPNPHLSFGYGPHYCPGAQLARMELQVALHAILARLPGLHIAVPEDQLTWHMQTMMRGLAAFPVTWRTPPLAKAAALTAADDASSGQAGHRAPTRAMPATG